MSQIFCKLVFRGFEPWQINNFFKVILSCLAVSFFFYIPFLFQLCDNHSFNSFLNLNISEPVSYGEENDYADHRQESEISFVIPKSRDNGDGKYRKFTEALCEISSALEYFQKELRSNPSGLLDSATVCMIVLSKNIYPKHFE